MLSPKVSRNVAQIRVGLTANRVISEKDNAAAAKAIRMTARTLVNHNESRVRIESNIEITRWNESKHFNFPSFKNITCAAFRVNKLNGETFVHFRPQTVDINLDQIGKNIEIFVPDMFGNFGASDDFAFFTRQIFEQRVFFGRQRNFASAAPDGLRRRVNFQIFDDNFRRANFAASPQQSAKPRQQFAEFKRFCQIIIRAEIKPGNFVFDRIARRQHQDRRFDIAFTQLAANCKTVFDGIITSRIITS